MVADKSHPGIWRSVKVDGILTGQDLPAEIALIIRAITVIFVPIILAILSGCDDARMERAQFRVQCEEGSPSSDRAAIDRCVANKFVAAHPKSHSLADLITAPAAPHPSCRSGGMSAKYTALLRSLSDEGKGRPESGMRLKVLPVFYQRQHGAALRLGAADLAVGLQFVGLQFGDRLSDELNGGIQWTAQFESGSDRVPA